MANDFRNCKNNNQNSNQNNSQNNNQNNNQNNSQNSSRNSSQNSSRFRQQSLSAPCPFAGFPRNTPAASLAVSRPNPHTAITSVTAGMVIPIQTGR